MMHDRDAHDWLASELREEAVASQTVATVAKRRAQERNTAFLWWVTGLLIGVLVATLTVLLFTENHETHHLQVTTQRLSQADTPVLTQPGSVDLNVLAQNSELGHVAPPGHAKALPPKVPVFAHRVAAATFKGWSPPKAPAEHLLAKPKQADATPAQSGLDDTAMFLSQAAGPAKGGYVLQVASTPRYADADHLKAKLLLLGHHVMTKKVVIDGQDWYQVQVGRNLSRQEALATQTALNENHIKSMMLSG